jgi:streptogramin lyase
MQISTKFLGLLLPAFAIAAHASAATLAGIARDPDGRPIADAFVTAHSTARRLAETVLSDRMGHYLLKNLYVGEYEVRVRKDGFADGTLEHISVDELAQRVDVKLQRSDPAALMRPGSAWLAAVPNDPMKTAFITSCTICHDPGSAIVRGPRDEQGWTAVIQKMRSITGAYGGLFKLDDAAAAKWLADTHFGAQAAPLNLFAAKAGVVHNAAISEYEVGSAETWAHDMAIDPNTGDAWVVDYVKDELIKVDPRSGRQHVFACPVKGAGMHTLNFDRDGTLWITFQLAGMIGRFDPRGEQWRLYAGLSPMSLPHSFALDGDGFVQRDSMGRIWFSEFGARAMAGLKPDSGELISIPLPGTDPGRPYGAAIDSQGRIWFSNYYDNEIGFVDPKTRQGERWSMKRPYSGPHRMHIDDGDNLWIPLSGYGVILRHNTRDGSEKEFALPDPDTFPYAVRFDRRSHRVWVTGNGANSIYALDPDTGLSRTFRLPSDLSYPRMISIDYATGDVWTALSSYPNVHAGRDHGLLLRIHDGLGAARQSSGNMDLVP